ncbi:MAG TPA: cytochrome c biogenesis protein CcdA [Jiangellaceae bacterium]
MSEIFLGGSLAAAFFAGSVALFAPCCITVLFPAYLASAVRNRRWRLVPLTFVFATGLAVVLVPITLGVGVLTEALLRYHSAVYALGGILMLGLAAVVVLGLHWALPMFKNAPDLQRTDSGGVFALGVFSGAASACCAPVLAGVVTLSAVTPGAVSSIAIGLAYTFGMVFPLVVITALWDRLGGRNVKIFRGRAIDYRLAGRQIHTTTLDLGVAAMFASMGILLLVVAAAGASLAPTFQVGIGLTITNWFEQIVSVLDPIPNAVIGLGLIALAATALALSARRPRSSRRQEDHAHTSGDSCHD